MFYSCLGKIFKYIFFLFHFAILILSFIGICWRWEMLILQGIIIFTWYVNDNRCMLTQLEDFLFNETIIDLYMCRDHKTYKVPKYHRFLLYIFFLFGILSLFIR